MPSSGFSGNLLICLVVLLHVLFEGLLENSSLLLSALLRMNHSPDTNPDIQCQKTTKKHQLCIFAAGRFTQTNARPEGPPGQASGATARVRG